MYQDHEVTASGSVAVQCCISCKDRAFWNACTQCESDVCGNTQVKERMQSKQIKKTQDPKTAREYSSNKTEQESTTQQRKIRSNLERNDIFKNECYFTGWRLLYYWRNIYGAAKKVQQQRIRRKTEQRNSESEGSGESRRIQERNSYNEEGSSAGSEMFLMETASSSGSDQVSRSC